MSSIDELLRLISSYQALSRKHAAARSAGAVTNARHLTEALDDVCLAVARFPADDPLINYAQIEFLIALLVEDRCDVGVREAVRDAVMAHVRRLADNVPRQRRPVALPEAVREV